MQHRLTWSQIREFFRDEWVELVDLEWDQEKSFPKLARVRHHSSGREHLLKKIKQSDKVNDSAILYLGQAAPLVKRQDSALAH